MKKDIRTLHDALLDIIGFMNRPEPDAALLADTPLPLERALMPLLVRIERRGPIGVGELAELVGRDYTTVSRQVARLDELGMVKRRASAQDKRVREAEVTEQGRAIADAIDGARMELARQLLGDWSAADRHDLARLMSRFAGEMSAWSARQKNEE